MQIHEKIFDISFFILIYFSDLIIFCDLFLILKNFVDFFFFFSNVFWDRCKEMWFALTLIHTWKSFNLSLIVCLFKRKREKDLPSYYLLSLFFIFIFLFLFQKKKKNRKKIKIRIKKEKNKRRTVKAYLFRYFRSGSVWVKLFYWFAWKGEKHF